jgi:hypothetical protein
MRQSRALVVLLALLTLGTFCSRNQSVRGVVGRKPVVYLYDEAYKPLTEDDVALVLRVWPSLERVLDSADYHWHAHTLDNRATEFAETIDTLRTVPVLEEALAESATDWPSFRAAAYRVMATILLIGLDESATTFDQQLRYYTRGQRQLLVSHRAESKAVLARVPSANKKVFERHYRELVDAFEVLHR